MFAITKLLAIGWVLSVVAILAATPPVYADELLRPQAFSELRGEVPHVSVSQRHYSVPGSTVAWADYGRLRRDFSQLRGWEDEKIDTWILQNFARVSESQIRLSGIRVGNFVVDQTNKVEFLHPHLYQRAAVAPAVIDNEVAGLIDLKGTGFGNAHASLTLIDEQIKIFEIIRNGPKTEKGAALDELRVADHSDGAMTLGEAIAEMIRQEALQREFDLYMETQPEWVQTVESYFIIRLPMTVLKDHDRSEPAAIYGRQAHWRGLRRQGWLPELFSDDFGGKQMTITGAIVDFGGIALEDPRLFETFGDPRDTLNDNVLEPKARDAQRSKVWAVSHEAAREFADLATRDLRRAQAGVRETLAKMLRPLDAAWAARVTVSEDGRLRQFFRTMMEEVDRTFESQLDYQERLKALAVLFEKMPAPAQDNFLARWTNPRAILHAGPGQKMLSAAFAFAKLRTSFQSASEENLAFQILRLELLISRLPKALAEGIALSSEFNRFVKSHPETIRAADRVSVNAIVKIGFQALADRMAHEDTMTVIPEARIATLLSAVDGRDPDGEMSLLSVLATETMPILVATKLKELKRYRPELLRNAKYRALVLQLAGPARMSYGLNEIIFDPLFGATDPPTPASVSSISRAQTLPGAFARMCRTLFR